MIHLFNFWRCWGKPHDWHKESDDLIGDWIRCNRCGALDEYVAGTHEPAGYLPSLYLDHNHKFTTAGFTDDATCDTCGIGILEWKYYLQHIPPHRRDMIMGRTHASSTRDT